ncbi:hypothetical protein [Mycobacterium intracellulare]|uniref:hypothetical protein n=1 Tax=Mycobacterium intracellulare TaxID=1767 RepID=UPI00109EBAD0|nr:hypothetical protein [Mycobacterium intracellulare]
MDEDKLHGWSDLLGNGEVIIIAIVIAAGAVGDLLSHERRKMLSNAALINAFMAFVVAAIGSLVYGRTTVRTRNAPTEDVNKLAAQLTHTTMASVALFAVSLIVGLCTIFLNTWEEKNSQ